MPLTWKDWVKQTVTSGGTGTVTLGAAVSGYQALGAADDGKLFPYSFQDGTATETGYGLYTNSGTTFARTVRSYSSTGSALNLTTSAVFFPDMVSTFATNDDSAQQSIVPGGRLTAFTGLPVPIADVIGATNIYYTPYLGNTISLWDGNRWGAITFSEVTMALGTMTSGLGYDVFGFLNSGALNIEKLAWSSNTARATGLSLQDGRYCKVGDKTRLWLGTIYTTSTTTIEDSVLNRFVCNAYNRVSRYLIVTNASSHTYSSGTPRPWGGTQSFTQLQVINGLTEYVTMYTLNTRVLAPVAGSYNTVNNFNIDGTSTTSDLCQFTGLANSQGVSLSVSLGVNGLGLHTVYCEEWDAAGATSTFVACNVSGMVVI